jgi:D-glycero-alpha-D-manno-heptose-7-phosphate kinase
LYALQHVMPSKAQLAQAAIHVEQDVLGEAVGCQDQVLAAHGGLCKATFFPNGDIGYTPIIMRPDRLASFQSHLQLYFTGFSRIASEVAREQIDRTKHRQRELCTMLQMVEEGMAILTGERDLADFGGLLHEAWMLKRRLTSRITTPAIDAIYAAAREAGALGGKLLGAGGGGFMLLFARPEDHERIRLALPGLLQVPFKFEGLGTHIVFYQEDQLMLDDVWAQSSAQTAARLKATLIGKAA